MNTPLTPVATSFASALIIVFSVMVVGCGGGSNASSSSSASSVSSEAATQSSVEVSVSSSSAGVISSSSEDASSSSSDTASSSDMSLSSETSSEPTESSSSSDASSSSSESTSSLADPTFYRGVDLSYVNEMEACGAVYYEEDVAKDPYLIFADHGANLVRLRLWHTPNWLTANPETQVNNFSNLADVKIAIARAKAQGFHVLLDFHYSDTWADPGRQNIPATWAALVNDTEALSQAVYDYTYSTLIELNDEGLMPNMVQVGNETNGSMMVTPGSDLFPIDWARNSALFNAGISAVRAAGAVSSIQPKIMLHIAEPENINWWFEAATTNGVTDFDIIGISYYSAWSDYSIAEVAALVEDLVVRFERDVIIVETALSWTDTGIDSANDILMRPQGTTVLSPEAQAQWLIDLTSAMFNHGGAGVVYWEPAWVSTDCYTQWAQGSHWETNTFFDFENKVITEGGIRFLSYDYANPEVDTSITFRVDMSGVGGAEAAYITGAFPGAYEWAITPMVAEGNDLFSFTLDVPPGFGGAYYFLDGSDWGDRETVPAECALMWDVDRRFDAPSEGENLVLAFGFGSCGSLID